MSKRTSKCLTVDFRREPKQWASVEKALDQAKKSGWNQGCLLRRAVTKYLFEDKECIPEPPKP